MRELSLLNGGGEEKEWVQVRIGGYGSGELSGMQRGGLQSRSWTQGTTHLRTPMASRIMITDSRAKDSYSHMLGAACTGYINRHNMWYHQAPNRCTCTLSNCNSENVG